MASGRGVTYNQQKNIATINMRNKFCYPLKISFLFLYCSPCDSKSCRSDLFNFCISFVDWFIASFLYCFSYSYRSSNYCDSNSCRSFTLSKVLAKSNGNLSLSSLRTRKSDNYCYRDSWKSDNFRGRAI